MHRHYRIAGAFALLGVTVMALGGCSKQPVAIVNGAKITQAEFVDRLEKVSGHDVLADMINRQIIEKAFADSGQQITAKEIDDKVAEIQQQFPSQEAFQQFLTQRGATLEDVKRDLSFSLKLEKLCTMGVKVSDEELKSFFSKYQARYDKPLRVTISEIVVATPEDAKKVRDELNKPDANFAALARQYSISPVTRERGGRRPEAPMAQLMPQGIQGAVQKLQPGQISDPIPAEGQFFIIKLEERKQAEKATFDAVKADVERDYKRSKAKSPDQLLQEYREKAVVNIVSPRYQDLAELFRPKQKLPTFGPQKGGQAPAGGAQGQQPAAPAQQGQAAPPSAPAQQPAAPAQGQ